MEFMCFEIGLEFKYFISPIFAVGLKVNLQFDEFLWVGKNKLYMIQL